jgi:hypothetical protein
MPLLKFDLVEGRDQQAVKKLLEAGAQALFELIISGEIVAEKSRTYPLRDVARAQRPNRSRW